MIRHPKFPRSSREPTPDLPLARFLREIRRDRKLNQKELAEITGVPRGTIASIESGRLVPSIFVLSRFAEALEIPVSELVSLAVESSKHFLRE